MLVIYTGTRAPDTHPDGLDLRHWPLLEPHFLNVDRDELLEWTRPTETSGILYSKHAVRAVAAWPWHEEFLATIQDWWAVGPKTAAFAHERLAIECQTPESASFDGLVDALREASLPPRLLALSVAGTQRNLDRAIGERDVLWRDIPVYETRKVAWRAEQREIVASEADWIALTSSKGVDALFELFSPQELLHIRFAAIGPSTAEVLSSYGISVDVIPESPGKRQLINAIATR